MTGLVLAGVVALFGWFGQANVWLQGYVEGDYLRIGSPVAGTLVRLDVDKGDFVVRGAPLFWLDQATELAARDQAAAQLAQAEADLANLRKGSRPEELAVIAAQRDRAEASLVLSQAQLRRQEELARTRVASPQQLDEARAAVGRDRAAVAEFTAQYRTALLGARADEIAAAQALVDQRAAELARTEQRLRDMVPPAPKDARVEDVYYRPGEYVPAGSPVVSLLPPDQVKLVFFVPEPRLGAVAMGQTVSFRCDACPPGQRARIVFLASRAEFTPPVIYSVGSRDKLVYRAEARPLDDPLRLHPGQPVDVALPPP